MQKQPIVSVIVLNYRSPRDAVACVRALLGQTLRDSMEVLLADNRSDDESIALFRAQFGREKSVKIIEAGTNLGYGKGMGLGARHATGRHLFFVNPDNVLPPDTLERMIDILERHPDIGILAPALTYPDGTVRPSARPFPTLRDLVRKRIATKKWHAEHARSMESVNGELRDVDWVAGTCMLLSRDLYGQLGGFDPRFFLFFEDTDLCRRCLATGKRVVYAPHIRVSDRKERLSDGGLLTLVTKRTARIHLASALRYFWKWRKGGAASAKTSRALP